MEKALWEKNKNGLETEWLYGWFEHNNQYKGLARILKYLARLKFITTQYISIKYQGDFFIFGCRVSVVVEYKKQMHYFALFDAEDETKDGRKLICVRHGVWDGEEEAKRFSPVTSLKDFILYHQPLTTTSIFDFRENHQEILNLADEVTNLVLQGIKLQSVEEDEESEYIHQIWCEIYDGSTHFCLSYYPTIVKSAEFMTWLEKWKKTIQEMDGTLGLLPDGPMTVSYLASLLEEILTSDS